MSRASRYDVFLSYNSKNRRFVEEIAELLRESGLRVYFDKWEIRAGQRFRKSIDEALTNSAAVVVFSGGEGIGSFQDQEIDVALSEHARDNTTVIPALLPGGPGPDSLPPLLRNFQAVDFRGGMEDALARGKLLEGLGVGKGNKKTLSVKMRGSFFTPPPPPHCLERPEALEALKEKLLRPGKQAAAATSARKVGVHGMGGLGKSVLAAMAARDERVRERFPDGVFWIALGQSPDLVGRQANLLKAFCGEENVLADVQEGKARLGNRLTDLACLLILDDVCAMGHAAAFNVLGERSQLLFTTRDSNLVTGLGADGFDLDLPSSAMARDLLARWTGLDHLPGEADAIIEACGGLPLAVAMVGAMLRGKPGGRWKSALGKLRSADLVKIKQDFPEYPHPNLFAALETGFEALPPETRERYLDFAVFRKGAPVPAGIVALLWKADGLEGYEVEDVLDELTALHLLRRERAGDALRPHDLQFDYLTKKAGARLPRLHRRLLNAYGTREPDDGETHPPAARLPRLHRRLLNAHGTREPDDGETHPPAVRWKNGPDDGYFFDNYCFHLHGAEEIDELKRLLLNYEWLGTRLRIGGVHQLTRDYRFLRDDPDLRRIRQALELSAHVLAGDPSRLGGQLYGRLPAHESETLRTFRDGIPWQPGSLRPLTRGLTAPGGAMMKTLTGHAARVSAVAISPDGRLAVSASHDKTLKVWDLAAGEETRTLTGHTAPVLSVVVMRDGRRAASASADHTLKIWDLRTGKMERTLRGHAAPVLSVTASPDGRRLASASADNTLKVWDPDSGGETRTLVGHGNPVSSAVVTPDGNFVASASHDKTLKIWDLHTGEAIRTLAGHTGWVTSAAVTPDGRFLVSASYDRTLKIWDMRTGREMRTLRGHAGWVTSAAVTPDGRRVLSASSDKTLKIWDLAADEAPRTLRGHVSGVESAAVTPDGCFAVSASYDNTLKIWDVRSAERREALSGHGAAVWSAAATPDGRFAVTASYDHTLKVWDLRTGEEKRTLRGHAAGVESVTISPDGRFAVSASRDRTLKIWEVRSGREMRTLRGHTDWVRSAAMTPDGRRVVSASYDKTLKVWDARTGEEVRTLRGHALGVKSAAVTPDGRFVASASPDKTLKVWDLLTGEETRTLEGCSGRIRSAAMSPDGRLVVSASTYHTIKVWNIRTGEETRTRKGHASWIFSVAVSPDGRFAVSASRDKTLKVWDLKTGEETRTLRGHTNWVRHAAVTPDGRCAASVSDDNTLLLWDLKTAEVIGGFTAEGGLTTCVVSPDGERIVAGDVSGRVHILAVKPMRENSKKEGPINR